MKDSKKIKSIMEFMGLFLILLYPFNATIPHIIYGNNNVLCIATIIIGIILLLISGNKKSITKETFLIFAITSVIELVTLVNNYYITEGYTFKVILFSIYLFIPLIIHIRGGLGDNLIKVLKVFSLEHLIGTYTGLVFKDFYKNSILELVCGSRALCVARGNFYHGYIPGLTSHFSTNGIYLSIASLVFFSEFLKKKDKKSLIFFIISIIALFTAGKRGQLIITILTCLVLYIIIKNKKTDIVKKTMKIIFFGIAAVGCFIAISKYIPEITNIMVRFEMLIDKGDVLNGRGELYSLAMNLWSNHLFIGNGWGAFSYNYQQYLYYNGATAYLDAHNVYIQLLCEVGIIGLITYAVIVLSNFVKSLNMVNLNIDNSIYYIIFAYSMFFILYSFTGNPLYDPMCYVLYFICLGQIIIKKRQKGDQNEKNRDNNILQRN